MIDISVREIHEFGKDLSYSYIYIEPKAGTRKFAAPWRRRRGRE